MMKTKSKETIVEIRESTKKMKKEEWWKKWTSKIGEIFGEISLLLFLKKI